MDEIHSLCDLFIPLLTEDEIKKIPRNIVIDSKLNEKPLIPIFEKPFEMKDTPVSMD